MKRFLEQAFGIRREEVALVQAFFLFFVGIGMFYTVGVTVGDTLFLSHLPADQVAKTLPFVYVGIAVAGFFLILVYDAVQQHVSRLWAIVGTQLILAVTMLVFRFAVDFESQWLYFSLIVWLEAAALLSITLFYSFAGDYFNARDARRCYGYIAGGMALGTIIAGFTTSIAVGFVGIRNLLYVCAGLLVLNALISWIIYLRHVPIPVELEADDTADKRVALKTIFSRRYVSLLALMIVLAIVVSVMVDYQMKWTASTMSENKLAEFFGSFYGRIGIAQILFQFVLVPRLLGRLGVINCLMILPVCVGLASLWLLGGSLFGYFGLGLLTFSATANFIRITLSETLDIPSRELMFLPLPTRVRMRAQPFMNGVLSAAARGFAGLLMLVLVYLNVGMDKLSWVVVLCSSLLVIVLIRLRPEYRKTLASTLRARGGDVADLEQAVSDSAADPILDDLLHSTDREVVKFTLGLLKQRPIGRLSKTIETLLKSSRDSVKVEVLGCLGPDSKQLQGLIRECMSDRTARVKEAAILALCRVMGQDVASEIFEFPSNGEQGILRMKIIGLVRYCGGHGRLLGQPLIEELASRQDVTERVMAAGLIATIGQSGNGDILIRLLNDADSDVRVAAVEAVAATKEIELVKELLDALDDVTLKQAAIRALASLPQECAEQVIDRIEERRGDVDQLRTLIHIVSEVGGPKAAMFLWEQSGDFETDLNTCFMAAVALRSLREREGLYNLKLKEYRERLKRLFSLLSMLDRVRREVGVVDPFVARIMADQYRVGIETMLSMFALKYHPRQIARISFNLFAETETMRARAAELLDELLPRQLAHSVIARVQRVVETQVATGERLSVAMCHRLAKSEQWLRMVAAYHLSKVPGAKQEAALFDLSALERAIQERLSNVELLKGVPLLKSIPAYQLMAHADIVEWVSKKEGQDLFAQGDQGDACYVVDQGEIVVIVDGKEVARLGPGECVGEMALIERQPRSATVKLATDARFLKIGTQGFTRLLDSQPTIARSLLATFDKRIRLAQAGRDVESPIEKQGLLTTHSGVVSRLSAPDLQQLIPVISFLCQVDMFVDLPMPSLTRLAGIVQEVSYQAGETLFEQGDGGDSLYLVCSGKVDVIVDSNTVATLAKKACIGEMALIGGCLRSATIKVSKDSRMLRLWSEDFNQLLATEPDVSMTLLKTLSARLRRISK
jgi:CRP-like cAMP-binding protein/ATP/ADP translocase